jgi:hypothetical protein
MASGQSPHDRRPGDAGRPDEPGLGTPGAGVAGAHAPMPGRVSAAPAAAGEAAAGPPASGSPDSGPPAPRSAAPERRGAQAAEAVAVAALAAVNAAIAAATVSARTKAEPGEPEPAVPDLPPVAEAPAAEPAPAILPAEAAEPASNAEPAPPRRKAAAKRRSKATAGAELTAVSASAEETPPASADSVLEPSHHWMPGSTQAGRSGAPLDSDELPAVPGVAHGAAAPRGGPAPLLASQPSPAVPVGSPDLGRRIAAVLAGMVAAISAGGAALGHSISSRWTSNRGPSDRVLAGDGASILDLPGPGATGRGSATVPASVWAGSRRPRLPAIAVGIGVVAVLSLVVMLGLPGQTNQTGGPTPGHSGLVWVDLTPTPSLSPADPTAPASAAAVASGHVTPAPSATPRPTATPARTPSPAPTRTSTPAATHTPTHAPTATPTHAPTLTASPTTGSTPTAGPTPTPVPTPTPSMFVQLYLDTPAPAIGQNGIWWVNSLPAAVCTITRSEGGRESRSTNAFTIGSDGWSGPLIWGSGFSAPVTGLYTFTAVCTMPAPDGRQASDVLQHGWP